MSSRSEIDSERVGSYLSKRTDQIPGTKKAVGRGTSQRGMCAAAGLSRIWTGARSNGSGRPCLRSSFSCFPRAIKSHSKYTKEELNDHLKSLFLNQYRLKKLKSSMVNSEVDRESEGAQKQPKKGRLVQK